MIYKANAWKDLRTEQIYVSLIKRVKGRSQQGNDWLIAEKSFVYEELDDTYPTTPTVCFDEYEALALYHALGEYFEGGSPTETFQVEEVATKLDFSTVREEMS